MPALSIVQEYGAKGFDVRMIERQAEVGYLPDDLLIKLRAFASQLNDDGSRKEYQFHGIPRVIGLFRRIRSSLMASKRTRLRSWAILAVGP